MKNRRVHRCSKEGCDRVAAWWVTLTDAEAKDSWWACHRHAQEFRAWIINETARLGVDLGTVELRVADGPSV